ncbi:MAG: alpha-galactosidase, partial [Candidatus Heimdallarchaeota archaeon]|nr:alpha-galactosidase [Candidatus Heimdallarchaeota archaeon]
LNTESGDVSLTSSREKKWKKWLNIYLANELPKQDYNGSLYDIGFDVPETHVIKKENTLFYAFYAKSYQGSVELRGLEKGAYKITDYVNQKELGIVSKDTPNLKVDFDEYLLIKASPTER